MSGLDARHPSGPPAVVRSTTVQPRRPATASATRAVIVSVIGFVVCATFAATPGSPFQPVLPQGAPTAGPVHLAREVHRVRRADGQLVDRGGGGLHRPGRRGVPDGPAGGLPRHDLVADRHRAGGRLSRRRLPVAVAVLARRLLLRLLRPHRGHLPPEPLRPHPRGVRRGFTVAAGGPEVGRHARGVRPAVHVAVGRASRASPRRRPRR